MAILDFYKEQEDVFNKIGESTLAALATSSENFPTVRTMSIIIHEKVIYFQTGIDLMKYRQISMNKNVALSINNIQIEGTANIMGKPVEHEEIMTIYKKYFKNSYEKYSKLEKEVLIKVIPRKITIWEYDFNGKPYRIFIEFENKKAYKEFYGD